MTHSARDTIQQAIPHRPPFLLIDEVIERNAKRIVCDKTFHGDEFWFAGHYPNFPLVPGVLLCEAAMQAGAVLLSDQIDDVTSGVPVATRANHVQFREMVRPGDTIRIEVELTDQVSTAYYLKARILVRQAVAARLEFACTFVSDVPGGSGL